MSHCITLKETDLGYSHFVSVCDKSESDDIIRLIRNNNGGICLSSNYSIADRVILFVSNIPWLSDFECISSYKQKIEFQQNDAVMVFLETLNKGFGNTFSLDRLPKVKSGSDYLKCRNVTTYLTLASTVNPSSFTAKYCNQKNLIVMKEGLVNKFPEIKREFYDCLMEKDDGVLKKFHDEINVQVDKILQTASVPESIYDVIKARILEFVNINALENSYPLDALKCYLYTLSGSDKEKESLNQVPGEPFALKMNERLALLNISMNNDSGVLDNLLRDVFLLNDELKLKSSEDKNLLCSGIYAYLAKQFYEGLIRNSIDEVKVERGGAEHLVPLSVPVTSYGLQESLSDTSSIDSFFSSVCSEDDNTEVISWADSDYFPPPPTPEELKLFQGDLSDIDDFPPPPTPEELKFFQGDLSDIDDFPPPPTAEELRLYQDGSSRSDEVDSLYGSASDESNSDNDVYLTGSETAKLL
ncbi:hypothetical protein J5069_22520 [Candidatus Symbiopectobacterium sp. NZEC127]|uniref:hypothetical protein n=1 Tax=Candidatus Symbiopectobacterium sp. NZEC127 TaxID=2820472 RepID=UPI002227EEC2|nr:hypothetical protein [Candidatus Symbiopectobacterium sp. NZEC127]MCW2488683.1 hypothetical protein [Candidatus Symbiopectobacterium sp. NZEC127]